MSDQKLQRMVADLPELYQVIYGHPEWDGEAARDCRARLVIIEDACRRLSRHLNRPLKVLDLGCAQGFFSLSLASSGATVTGVDFQAENIDVCSSLAEENPDLQVCFVQARIENFVETLDPGEYDVVLGLSVFHHLVYLYGVEYVSRLLMTLMNVINLGIFEFALREEPLYWGSAQPDDPRDLIDGCAFRYQIASHETHLSHVRRPMYLVSNRTLLSDNFCDEFERWSAQPYSGAREVHNGSRRYYWGSAFFGKVFDFTSGRKSFPPEVGLRNKSELIAETGFLARPPESFETPRLLAYGKSALQGWIVTSVIDGVLLSDMTGGGRSLDVDRVLSDILQQLATLEDAGLYHDDIRLWNVMYDRARQRFKLIDYGSIGMHAKDCVWPHDIFQAFFIFVHELLMPDVAKVEKARPPLLSPFHLARPYAGWLYAFWQRPVSQWRFSLLAELFEQRMALPQPADCEHGVEAWLRAHELNVLERLHRESDLRDRVDGLSKDRPMVLESLSQMEETVSAQAHAIAAIEGRLQVLTDRYEACAGTLQAVYRSRSWRMMAPYRYLGLQVALLRQYGIRQRCKHFIKRLFRLAVRLANRHPAMKNLAFRILRLLGLYGYVHRIHRRIMPVEIPPADAAGYLRQHITDQLADRKLLPPVVNDLFEKLSRR
ncbi:methyltransferase domain-containing protein [Rhizobium sp. P44RR-XXIV]|uniref:methyltransferase domain-containing protein n=1 Tax=Rhizobium sp. P44RR-XXIV TaxID=1921145 RepID=UPI0009866A9D|nr:methyltransferase domain-containing protein [Rhizobium sp. P44RR-XXIV]TIX90757.1 methyltransferase domain-containing protein [Rhizobium sp. P44RR-XXIV]